MTSPINPTVIQQPGALDNFGANFLNAFSMMQQAKERKRQLDLEEQRTNASVAASKQQTAESKARLKAAETAAAQERISLEAQDAAASAYLPLATMSGGLSPENIAEVQRTLMSSIDPNSAAEAMVAFNSLIATGLDEQQAQANNRLKKAEADVATATVEAQIQSIEMQPLLDAAQVAETRATTALRRVQTTEAEINVDLTEALRDRDPTRVARATSLYEMGVPWGQARESAGLAAGGIPDDSVYNNITGGAAAGAAAAEARNFALQMIPANATVNSLTRDTTDKDGNVIQGERINVTTSIQAAAGSNTLNLAINAVQSPKQQKMLQAGLQYVMSYRFFMSGQQSSDKEYLNMMKITFELAGDSDEMIRQKRMMRQLQTNALIEVAGGTVNPVDVLNDAIEIMKIEGLAPEFIRGMEVERNLAARHQAALAAGTSDSLQVSSGVQTGGDMLNFGRDILDLLTVTDSAYAASGNFTLDSLPAQRGVSGRF